MGVNRTNRRVSRTGVKGSNPSDSGSGNSAVDRCPSPTPPYICICNGSIGNIGQNTTPNFRETSELHAYIDRRLSNDYNAPYVGSQIIHDKLSVSYGRDIYLRCSMNVAAESVQTMVPQIVSHGLLTIDILNENYGIWIPDTSDTRKTPDTNHGRASENVVGKGTSVV